MHISPRLTPWAFSIHSISREMDKSIVRVSSHFHNPRLKPWAMNTKYPIEPFQRNA
jgi:hypothetical protein